MHPQDLLLVSREAIDNLPRITMPLLEWYDKSARSLPWRENPTPYRVWISEIMLQQTRVQAVMGYYARFLSALPDIQALANVREDVLLKLWEGLGYYSRARNLKRAAQAVLEQFGGALPTSYSALLSLPGIGEYTAGAIASIAFGIPVPAVDGNVLRVLSRILASYANVSDPAVQQACRKLLLCAIPPSRPGDFNQSLMELGATVCLPNGSPLCGSCPVAHLCGARQGNCQQELPVKAAKKARRVEERTVVVIVSGDRTLLFRRSDRLLSGMYEPLNLTGISSADEVREAVTELGANPSEVFALRDSKHLFTHVEWRMTAFLVYSDSFPPPENAVWAGSEALAKEFALPSAFAAYTKDLPLWFTPGA